MNEYTITQETLIGSTRVIVDYTMDKGGPMEWRDALHFTIQNWDNQTPELLETEMRRRHDSWILAITAPRVIIEPTPEEREMQLAALKEQLAALHMQIVDTIPDDEAKLEFVRSREAVVTAEIATLEAAIIQQAGM